MTDTVEEAGAEKRFAEMSAEIEHGANAAKAGFFGLEGLEELAHLADDRFLALAGAKERMLPAGDFTALVKAYLLDRQEPEVAGSFGLARASLMMGIVDGLRDFVRS